MGPANPQCSSKNAFRILFLSLTNAIEKLRVVSSKSDSYYSDNPRMCPLIRFYQNLSDFLGEKKFCITTPPFLN